MSAVKNFTFFSEHAFPFIWKFFYHLLSFVSIISYLLYTQISVVIQRFTTSEDVCWNIPNVKIKPFFFPEMRLYFLMFITAVCFLFPLKLRWPEKQKYVRDSALFFALSFLDPGQITCLCRLGAVIPPHPILLAN